MTLVNLIIAVGLPLLLGFLPISWFFKQKLPSFSILLPLSFFIGSALLTMLLFLLSVFAVSWSNVTIMLVSIGSLCIAFITFFKRRKEICALVKLRHLQLSGKEWGLLLLILVNLAMITYLAINKPVVNWDAWANWSLRAKVFYFEKGIPINTDHPYFLGRGGHVNYPLHIPIFEAWIYVVLGQWNDQMIKIIFPLYAALFSLFVYALVRPIANRVIALLFCLLFTLLPFVAYHSFSEYADLPTGLYLGMATGAAWLFLQTKDKGYLLSASLLLGMGGWVKNEGLLLGAIAMGMLLIYLKKHVSSIVLPAVMFITPWLIFKKQFGLGISNFGATVGMGAIAFHKEAIGVFVNELLRIENFGLLWLATGLIVLFQRKIIRNLQLGIFSAIALAFFLFYGGIYLLTENAQFAKEGIVIARNLLTVVPVLFWVIALVFARALTSEKNRVK